MHENAKNFEEDDDDDIQEEPSSGLKFIEQTGLDIGFTPHFLNQISICARRERAVASTSLVMLSATLQTRDYQQAYFQKAIRLYKLKKYFQEDGRFVQMKMEIGHSLVQSRFVD
jgi:hypothetical protein